MKNRCEFSLPLSHHAAIRQSSHQAFVPRKLCKKRQKTNPRFCTSFCEGLVLSSLKHLLSPPPLDRRSPPLRPRSMVYCPTPHRPRSMAYRLMTAYSFLQPGVYPAQRGKIRPNSTRCFGANASPPISDSYSPPCLTTALWPPVIAH